MKRMLINATQEEELRMAMVDGQRLYDLNIEGPASERKKANIYKGKITRIEPSLEAAFVDYGAERHGFLPLKEISSEYFVKKVDSGGKPNIREVLNEGQDIVVQIDKEERGNKGAALTTYVSLAGRFIVLKPNKARSGGVSRRIVGSDRDLARKSLSAIDVPDGMSVILRTAGIDRSAEELAWDLENLLTIWQAILNVVLQRPSPFLIYRESNAVVRALRDYLTNEIGEILIDDEATHKEAMEFVEQVMPHNVRKVKHYSDPVPLFTRFQIESQIESAFAHTVTLPSGGSIVIDHTEALVAIDINSARATKGGDIEATALNTNLEAADEIARQLRIRDLGGLVVIDFIDMGPQKNQRAVENRLREAVRQDRARVQIGKITRFGLLEMSRQRLRPSLGESSYQTCPRCSGFGTIRSVESLALAILRIVGEEARKERTVKVIAQLPVEVATYLLNEKRDWVRNVETSNDTQVVLIANSALETPHYDVRRVRDDQAELPENAGVSYSLAESEPEPELPSSMQERQAAEKAAIGKIEPVAPAPKREEPETGFWAWVKSLFASEEKEEPAKKRKASPGRRQKSGGGDRKRQSDRRGRRGGDARRDDGRRSKKKQSKKKAKKTAAKKSAGGQRDQQKPRPDAKQDESREDSKRSSRNRRSRGGRRRRRSGDRSETANQAGAESAATQTDSKSSEKPAAERKPRQKADRRPKEKKPDAKPEQATDSKSEARPEQRPEAKQQDKPAAPQSKDRPAEPKQAEKPAEPKQAEKAAESKQPEKPAAAKKPERAKETSDPKPASEKSTKAQPAPKKDAGNGHDEKQAKSDARLLPWEPTQPPAKVERDVGKEAPRPQEKGDATPGKEAPSQD